MTGRSSVADQVEACAADPDADPQATFDDPQSVVDAWEAGYEARLSVLQRWRSRHNDRVESVAAAIRALEAGAALGTDEPEGAPEGWGYGGRPRS